MKTSQQAKILGSLRDHRFLTNLDLNRMCFRYSARIHELRKEGYNIQREYVKPGIYRYWLKEDA